MSSIRLLASSRQLLPSLCARNVHAQAETTKYKQYDYNSNSLPFQNLYPWKSLKDFVDRLENNILFADENIVAIDKPFGVGIHKPHPTIKKQNSNILSALSFGDPRFCIDDALPLLSERLKTPQLGVARSIDRFESGVVLLAKNEKGTKVIQSINRKCKPQMKPFATFWCITKGYPVIAGNYITERVTVQKIDVDELAEYREPILVKDVSKGYMKKHEHDFTSGTVEMRVLETNKEFAVSLVQIMTTQIKFSLVRCYAASKTSFIIGDTRFAKRVRHVLGHPITLQPAAVPEHDNFEPLPFPVCKRLLVSKNSQVPLMLHLKSIKIPDYGPKRSDVDITTTKLPEHFDWALYRLFLGRKNKD